MEVIREPRVTVSDASGAGAARRRATELATDLGFGETDVGRVAVVVTEAATNLAKHASGGEIVLGVLRTNGRRGIGVLALDRGPGIDPAIVLRDGFSTAGSAGTGLGAIRRMATFFDCYSTGGAGTAILATLWPGAAPQVPGLEVEGVNVPHPREEVSGDAWEVDATGGRTIILLCDGLGHGPHAAEASRTAMAAFRDNAALAIEPLVTRIHEALRPTRGAAIAVAEIDRSQGVVRFAGIGNIAGTILSEGGNRNVVSHHGVAGHAARRIQSFTYPWPPNALLVLHSDGLVSQWSLERHPGLMARHPLLIAGILYRDFGRGRDDASVVVARGGVA
jgi:anti-sigma regulatory factor (Ser/Thr protein kinase)